ncbi:putative nucleic acid-binding protein [Deinococcus sp. UYEF24]
MVTPTSSVLLDTNVLSELSRPRPDPQVSSYLDTLPLEKTFISAVSVAEVERGIVTYPMPKGRGFSGNDMRYSAIVPT